MRKWLNTEDIISLIILQNHCVEDDLLLPHQFFRKLRRLRLF